MYLIVGSALLWRCAHFVSRLAKETETEASWELREEQYVHLVGISNMLGTELHDLRILLDGNKVIASQHATRLAQATPADTQRWEIRNAALLIVGRLERLSRAVQIQIFEISDVWDSNGEAMLAADRRIRPLLEEVYEANPGALQTYDYLVDELQAERARRRLIPSTSS